MNAVLQLQPADETNNVISFDPARRSRLSAVAEARVADRRPVRTRSLAVALAVGAVIGALISLNAVDAGSTDLTGDQIKTEAVAPLIPDHENPGPVPHTESHAAPGRILVGSHQESLKSCVRRYDAGCMNTVSNTTNLLVVLIR